MNVLTNKLICLTLILLATYLVSDGKDYYVKNSVNHSGNGSVTAPFKTIQEAASIMKPGDNCYISTGTYREIIRPLNSGNKEAVITFQPWHPEDKVKITGLDLIDSKEWIPDGKTFYKAKVNLDLDDENQVFKNDKMLHLACWPNQGDDLLTPALSEMTEGTTPDLIVDKSLPDYDYTNASVWVHAREYWSNWTTNIVASTKGKLQIKNMAPFPGPRQHVTTPKAQYYVFGILDALDSENEWFYDKEKKALYIHRDKNMVAPRDISYKKRMYAFDLNNKSYITILNLEITGASITTNTNSNHILLDGLKVLHPYHSSQANDFYGNQTDKGILFQGKNCTIQNSEVAYSSGSGVVLDGEYNKIINCYIHDTDYIGTYASCVQLKGKGNMVSHSTLTRSGRSVIDYGGMYQALIQFNDLSHSGMLTSDLGITYGNVIEGGNSEIRYNWLHDNDDEHKDMGLYFDHGTQNIISHHNAIWGIGGVGLLINHYGNYHLIYNNTFISQHIGFRSAWGNKYAPDLYGCRFANNIFSGPAETTADNYFWSNNLTDFTALRDNKYLEKNSDAIDRGVFIKGITRKFESSSPDIGAYEYNGENWIPGYNFKKFPIVDTVRSNPIHRNMIINSAFEHEDHLSPWTESDKGVKLIQHANKNQGTLDTAEGRMGSHSVELAFAGSEIRQRINGMQLNGQYTFTGHVRVDKGERVVFGVRFSNGKVFLSPEATTGAPNWRRINLNFTLDDKSNSVEVFVRRLSDGKGKIYLDDFGLIMQ